MQYFLVKSRTFLKSKLLTIYNKFDKFKYYFRYCTAKKNTFLISKYGPILFNKI